VVRLLLLALLQRLLLLALLHVLSFVPVRPGRRTPRPPGGSQRRARPGRSHAGEV